MPKLSKKKSHQKRKLSRKVHQKGGYGFNPYNLNDYEDPNNNNDTRSTGLRPSSGKIKYGNNNSASNIVIVKRVPDEQLDEEFIETDFNPQNHGLTGLSSDKNRYKDVLPYEYNKVKFSKGGYINASYIPGNFTSPNSTVSPQNFKYIATQGPLSTTVDDFWTMIHENDITAIIMVTKLQEGSRNKCHKYWPEEKKSQDVTINGEKINLTNHDETPYKTTNGINYTVSEENATFRITRLKLGNKEILHFHYLRWPDHGVVGDTANHIEKKLLKQELTTGQKKKLNEFTTGSKVAEMKSLLAFVLATLHFTQNQKIVVHCSAGVGRTGVFITLYDMLTKYLEFKKNSSMNPIPSVLKYLRGLRNYRIYAIQTQPQYHFLDIMRVYIYQYNAKGRELDNFIDHIGHIMKDLQDDYKRYNESISKGDPSRNMQSTESTVNSKKKKKENAKKAKRDAKVKKRSDRKAERKAERNAKRKEKKQKKSKKRKHGSNNGPKTKKCRWWQRGCKNDTDVSRTASAPPVPPRGTASAPPVPPRRIRSAPQRDINLTGSNTTGIYNDPSNNSNNSNEYEA